MKNNSQPAKRDSFASSFGVLVALAGSAVGLGNLWRFPYLVGENGGAAFILIYLGFVILGKTIFDLFDFISADFLMLIGGLLIVIFAGWKLGKAAVFDELTNGGTHPVPAWLLKTILFLIRYVAPAALLAIAIFQIHE